MAREPRAFVAGDIYHLISRVIAREFLISTSLQRSLYLDLQWRALRRVDWRLIGFALMSNHIHLVAVAGEAPLHAWLKPVHSRFADIVNRHHKRIGPVLVRGPRAYAIDAGRAPHLLAYVHNNPVRAGLVETAAESRWTSHRAYIGAEAAPLCLDIGLGRQLLGATSDHFDEWVADPVQRSERSFSEEAHELDLRQREGRELFVSPSEYDRVASVIVERVATAVHVPTLRGATRKAPEVRGRELAYRCAALLGLSEVSIARALGVSQQRVSWVLSQDASSEMADLVIEVGHAVRREIAG